MITNYSVKGAAILSEKDIRFILHSWNIAEWNEMQPVTFRHQFSQSEFHLLTDEKSELLCVARINFDFKLRIRNKIFEVAELVGLVAVQKNKGYGSKLLACLIDNLKSRNIEAIGFCEMQLRPFYEKCNVIILPGKAKQLREKENDEWKVPTDDDILNLNLSEQSFRLLESLSPLQLGYLLFN